MLHAAVRARLREVLDPDPAPEPAEGDRLAAVLAPLVLAPEPALIFTERAAELSRHAGEVSFPGGLQDPGETLVETALREAHERPMELARPGGGTWHGWAYELEGHTIWGATGWMLHGLLELLRKETTWTR
jgi:hypothetical protein